MEARAEMGTVRDDEVRGLAGQDSMAKVEPLTDVVSESEQSSITTECV